MDEASGTYINIPKRRERCMQKAQNRAEKFKVDYPESIENSSMKHRWPNGSYTAIYRQNESTKP